MEHFNLMVQFMSKEELEKELHAALTVDNEVLAKLIADELFERKLSEFQE
jgi:hypothetical protein